MDICYQVLKRAEVKKWKSVTWDLQTANLFCHEYGDWMAILMQKKMKKPSYILHLANLRKRELEISDLEINEKIIDNSFERNSTCRMAFVFEDKEIDVQSG